MRRAGSVIFKIKAYGPAVGDAGDFICLVFATNGISYICGNEHPHYWVEGYDHDEEVRLQLERVIRNY